MENCWGFPPARVFATYFNHQADSFPVLKKTHPCSLGTTSLNIEGKSVQHPLAFLKLFWQVSPPSQIFVSLQWKKKKEKETHPNPAKSFFSLGSRSGRGGGGRVGEGWRVLRSQHRRSRIFLPPLLKLKRKITTVRSASGSLASQLQSPWTKKGVPCPGRRGREARRRDPARSR